MLRIISNFLKTMFNSEVSSECKHKKTKIKGKIKIVNASFDGGKQGKIKLSLILNQKGEVEHCLKCIEEDSIRCAWCGGSILPLDPITLYSSTQDNFEAPKYAIEYNPDNHDNPSYVGCLRWNCADTGGDMSGFWGYDKKVHRRLSPIEQVMQNGKPVVINDFG